MRRRKSADIVKQGQLRALIGHPENFIVDGRARGPSGAPLDGETGGEIAAAGTAHTNVNGPRPSGT